MRKLYLLICIGILLPGLTLAQRVEDFENLESVGQKGFFKTYFTGLFKGIAGGSPFSMNGGVGLDQRAYSAFGAEARQAPYYYTLNANVNVQVYKVQIPISLLVTAQNTTAAYPKPKELIDAFKGNIDARKKEFARFGASPYYKWIKLHLGYRNMTFSQFTLSNLTFLGAGAELTPGKVRFATFYGRLAKSEPVDLSLTEPNLPVFRRKGWGVKAGYGTPENFVDFILFKGWDDPLSIPAFDPQKVFPNENLVVGFNAQRQILKKVRLSLDYANSALTSNTAEAPAGSNKFPHPAFLLKARTGTAYANALDAKADYLGNGYSWGLGYKRIEPDYRSLGAYFFDNDIENYTVNASLGLFKQQVQLTGTAGIQRDNLDDAKPSTMKRFIGSGAANYTKDRLSLGVNFSNFSSNIEYVINPELDSLNVVVVTWELGGNATYTLSDSKTRNQTISLNTSYQIVTDDIEMQEQSGESNMVNANVLYALLLKESTWRFTANWNYNHNELSMMRVGRWGLGGGAGRSFLKNKLSAGLNLTYFRVNIESLANSTNNTWNFRVYSDYRVSKSHSLSLNFNLLRIGKSDHTGKTDAFTEAIGNLSYRYNFAFTPRWKKSADSNEKK